MGKHSKKYKREKASSTGGMTHREIAKELGISKSLVHYIEQDALRKLAHPKNAKLLKQFLRS